MQKETKLEEILRLTLESLQKQEYSTETLLRYQKKFNALNSFAHSRGISEPSDGLFQEYLNDNKNKYTGEYSVFKERQRIRVVNLIKSYITSVGTFRSVPTLLSHGSLCAGRFDGYIKSLLTFFTFVIVFGQKSSGACLCKPHFFDFQRSPNFGRRI